MRIKVIMKIAGAFALLILACGFLELQAGICLPNAKQYTACDDCLSKERKCNSSGSAWGNWSDCGGTAPSAGGCTGSAPASEKKNCGKCNLGTQRKQWFCNEATGNWYKDSQWSRCIDATGLACDSEGTTMACRTNLGKDGTKTCTASCQWGQCVANKQPDFKPEEPSGGCGLSACGSGWYMVNAGTAQCCCESTSCSSGGFCYCAKNSSGGGGGGGSGGSGGSGGGFFPPGGGSSGGSGGGLFPPGGGSSGGSGGGLFPPGGGSSGGGGGIFPPGGGRPGGGW